MIPNPVKQKEYLYNFKRQNIILNVGSFGDQKNQTLLIDYFIKLNATDWKLIFIGDGILLEYAKIYTELLDVEKKMNLWELSLMLIDIIKCPRYLHLRLRRKVSLSIGRSYAKWACFHKF